MKLLIVVDMQNDFITGSLANPEAQKIVPAVAEYIKNFDGMVIATQDTHHENYLDTQEGEKLPVEHCMFNTHGWMLEPSIYKVCHSKSPFQCLCKESFGSVDLAQWISCLLKYNNLTEIEFCGVCTDICVISNALLAKAAAPEIPVFVHRNLCAGVTPESHENALKAMAACQIDIID